MTPIQNLNTWYECIKSAGKAKPLQEIQLKTIKQFADKPNTARANTAKKVSSIDLITSSIFD